jgi:hypothetical protein
MAIAADGNPISPRAQARISMDEKIDADMAPWRQ